MSNDIANMIDLMNRLREASIYCSVRSTRNDSISVDVSVPGQRWEVDFLSDGTVEIEIFVSDGNIYDGSKLDELFLKFSN